MAAVELRTYGTLNEPLLDYALTADRVRQIADRLRERESRSVGFRPIMGRLVALDVDKNEFQLILPGNPTRVRGTAAFFPITLLSSFLGESVTLEGVVTLDGKKTTIAAYNIVDLDGPLDPPPA